jgi:geranylgeranyl diphosphate synthase type II
MARGREFEAGRRILNLPQTSEQLGKTAGKDSPVEKATYPSIVDLEKSRKIADELTGKAFAVLKVFKGKAVTFEPLADYWLRRDR